ncbi:MAG: uroporphyrinogen-III synthase [Candidatus Bathyarchaeota archaeon]|nr:uroporphyrinogen-III synthase [Candidatus Bathyarchaeota archaeon]
MVQSTPNLAGKTVALTRPTGQAQEAGDLITAMGGVPYYIPAIEIKPLSSPDALKKFVAELAVGKVDYVMLMSTNGVKYMFEAAESLGLSAQLRTGLAKAYVIGVGPRTAQALTDTGVRVDLVPQKYSGEGLLEALQNRDLTGKVIRIPRTSNATPFLAEKLRERGADVEEIYVYESGLPVDEALKTKFYEDLQNGKINAVVFGSGLSAKNIFTMLTEKAPMDTLRGIFAAKVAVVAIGPTTAEALKELNVKVDVIPEDYLFEKALSALAQYWANR